VSIICNVQILGIKATKHCERLFRPKAAVEWGEPSVIDTGPDRQLFVAEIILIETIVTDNRRSPP
jgi:hypothetical protein